MLAVERGEAFESRRFLDDALEALQGGGGAVAPDEKKEAADVGHISQQICQPDLADKSSGADEQDLLAAQRLADEKGRVRAILRIKTHDRQIHKRRRAASGLNGTIEDVRAAGESKIALEPFTRDAAIGLVADDFGERTAGANHGIEQAAGGDAIAEIQAIRNDPRDAEMIRQRPHHVVEALADEEDFRAACKQVL